MTFGLTDKADLTREEGARHQLLESGWFFTALDDATEAELSAIVRKGRELTARRSVWEEVDR